MAEFEIRQGATQPILVMALNRDNDFTYLKFQKALENCAITFSMMDVETGVYVIAKNLGGLIEVPQHLTEIKPIPEYYIYYKFSNIDTNKPGRYKGEFKIDFFDTVPTDITGTFIAPIADDLFINIKKSLFTQFNSNNTATHYHIFTNQFLPIFD